MMGYFSEVSIDNMPDAEACKMAFKEQMKFNRYYVYPEALSVLLKEHGLQKNELAQRLGIDNAILTRATRKYFELGIESIIGLFPNIFPISSHEFLFGEQGIAFLPRYLQQVVLCAKKLCVEERRALLDQLEHDRQTYELQHGRYEPSYNKVLSDRIHEVAGDDYCADDEFLGDYWVSNMSVSVRNSAEWKRYRKTKMETVMYYALATNNAFDYYVRQDYTQVLPIAYRCGTRTVRIRNKEIIRIISELLRMPPDLRAKNIAFILFKDMEHTA